MAEFDARHFPRKEAFPTRFIEVTGKAAAVVNARRRALASDVGGFGSDARV